MDAVPGYTNETWFKATKNGVFEGQCAEFCGANHPYMTAKVPGRGPGGVPAVGGAPEAADRGGPEAGAGATAGASRRRPHREPREPEQHGDTRVRGARARDHPARRVGRGRAGWIDWVTTTDHKKIGILYLFTTAFFFLVGGVEALLMRIQLGSPDNTFLDPTTYSQLFTLHGTTMIFLVVVPIAAGFGNYLVPLMIGARDMAFPRLNMLSWWLLVFGGAVLYGSIFWEPPSAGWTSYAPLSETSFLAGHGIDAWILGAAPRRASPRSSARSTSSRRSTTCARPA